MIDMIDSTYKWMTAIIFNDQCKQNNHNDHW